MDNLAVLTPENISLWRERAEQQAGEALVMAVVRENNPDHYQFWLRQALIQAKTVEALNYLSYEAYRRADWELFYK